MNAADSDFNPQHNISMPLPAVPASATEMSVATSPQRSNSIGHAMPVGGNAQGITGGVPPKIEEGVEPR